MPSSKHHLCKYKLLVGDPDPKPILHIFSSAEQSYQCHVTDTCYVCYLLNCSYHCTLKSYTPFFEKITFKICLLCGHKCNAKDFS